MINTRSLSQLGYTIEHIVLSIIDTFIGPRILGMLCFIRAADCGEHASPCMFGPLNGLVTYGPSPASAPAGVALAYVVGVFCFAGIGMLLASLAPTARAAQSVGLLLWFIMLFVSGTSAPLDLLPNWMVDIGKALPLYHLVIALVDPWIGRGVNWMQLGIVALVGLVTTLLSLRLFRWE